MVSSTVRTLRIQHLVQRNKASASTAHDRIKIESAFQRGSEAKGVWDVRAGQLFIDSIQRGYPPGIIMLVRSEDAPEPWKVLDGGNRLRALRAFLDNDFQDLDGRKFQSDDAWDGRVLDPEERADFKAHEVAVQEITVGRGESNAVCEMFIRINTTGKPLKDGETFKGLGWNKDYWVLEMAKAMIGPSGEYGWTDHNFNDSDHASYGTAPQYTLAAVRAKWEEAIGTISERPRYQSFAMAIGFIVSAHLGDFSKFSSRFRDTSDDVREAGPTVSAAELQNVLRRLHRFADVLSKINKRDPFVKEALRKKSTKGFLPKLKAAPIWKRICNDALTPTDEQKIIDFYNSPSSEEKLLHGFLEVGKGSNSDTSAPRIERIISFILTKQSNEELTGDYDEEVESDGSDSDCTDSE
jgi:hypothetical protein